MNILFHDDYFVAINKPSGLLVHRSEIDRHETRFALQMVRDHIGQRVFPLHRLDKPTSGVLLFSLQQDIARKMMVQFVENQVQKSYLAVVRGYSNEHELIDYPLKEELDKIADRKARQDKAAQEAVTEYQRLATIELPYPVGRYQTARYSLLKVMPRTGRKHQIRRHMKHIFHPIVGDTTHGDGKHNQLFRDKFDVHRLLLHAQALSFTHPVEGRRMTIRAGLDDTMDKLIHEFGWLNSFTDLAASD
ncbi:MAG: tRNA pseudouridine(65) synthase TruC [Gammaproteobacteria bacterium]|nr:tRNA pseudouridine(65) synthase TruC [Gammaproteobacteria bacterium]